MHYSLFIMFPYGPLDLAGKVAGSDQKSCNFKHWLLFRCVKGCWSWTWRPALVSNTVPLIWLADGSAANAVTLVMDEPAAIKYPQQQNKGMDNLVKRWNEWIGLAVRYDIDGLVLDCGMSAVC